MFTLYLEKSDEERAAIAERERDRQAGIAAAANFIREHQILRDRAIELSVRSAPVTNKNWTSELSQEWRDFRSSVIESYTGGMYIPAFLEGERTNEELEDNFTYGLHFALSDLKNGEFEFGA